MTIKKNNAPAFALQHTNIEKLPISVHIKIPAMIAVCMNTRMIILKRLFLSFSFISFELRVLSKMCLFNFISGDLFKAFESA